MKLKKYDLSRVKITQVQSSEHDVLQQFRTHIISTQILNKIKISPHQSNCLLSKIQVIMCIQYAREQKMFQAREQKMLQEQKMLHVCDLCGWIGNK